VEKNTKSAAEALFVVLNKEEQMQMTMYQNSLLRIGSLTGC
jgi:hypothetical protein